MHKDWEEIQISLDPVIVLGCFHGRTFVVLRFPVWPALRYSSSFSGHHFKISCGLIFSGSGTPSAASSGPKILSPWRSKLFLSQTSPIWLHRITKITRSICLLE